MTIPAALDVPQSLYRFYDAASQLLYIGVSSRLGARWEAHNRLKPWWQDVARATVEHYPNRVAVLAAEEAAIKTEKPIHNIIHNRRRERAAQVDMASTAPTSATPWTFSSLRSGYTRTVPLWLYWEVNCDPITDEYLPDEIDAIELWNEWRRRYPPENDPIFGPGIHRIWWYVEGTGVFDAAPGQDVRGIKYPPRDTFLDDFTWPIHPETGEPVQWTRLPVVDKLWRPDSLLPKGGTTKGGFIQEATGWKPAPFQPCMDVLRIEALARL